MINDAPDHGFKLIVTEQMRDYCKRELGRPLDNFEFGVLQDMISLLSKTNHMLRKKGHPEKVRSADALVEVFCERVKIKEAEAAGRKIMVGYSGGRRDGKH
jgi:hypothetical protein